MTLTQITKINIVRERKKRPLRFCTMLYKTILAFKKRWVKCFFEIHYLGIQGRGKGHKVKHLKIIFLIFLRRIWNPW